MAREIRFSCNSVLLYIAGRVANKHDFCDVIALCFECSASFRLCQENHNNEISHVVQVTILSGHCMEFYLM